MDLTAKQLELDAVHNDVRRTVGDTLAGYMDTKLAQYPTPVLAELLPILRAFVLSGKRMRPLFCYWGWRGAGGSGDPRDTAAIMPACAAIEMLHAGLGVHDDIVDDGLVRRGRPTVRSSLTALIAKRGFPGDSRKRGDDAAIFAGDMLLVWSEELFQSCAGSSEHSAAAAAAFTQMRNAVTAGQAVEFLTPLEGSTLADALLAIELKTVSYTVEGPLVLGGVLAGASPHLLAAYRSFARPLGEAMQLLDDVVDTFGGIGDTSMVTPETIAEIRQHNVSALTVLARDRANPRQLTRLAELHGKPDLDPAEAAEVQSILTTTGARATVEEMYQERFTAALAQLPAVPIRHEARVALQELAKGYAHSLIRHATHSTAAKDSEAP